jgi:hypothetical protein
MSGFKDLVHERMESVGKGDNVLCGQWTTSTDAKVRFLSLI